MLKLAHLPDRSVIAVGGPDRVAFLQGLVSNDVSLVAPGRAVWAALLTPQGKWLAGFFFFHARDRGRARFAEGRTRAVARGRAREGAVGAGAGLPFRAPPKGGGGAARAPCPRGGGRKA